MEEHWSAFTWSLVRREKNAKKAVWQFVATARAKYEMLEIQKRDHV